MPSPTIQKESLLVFNENGIYCPPGDFYIDPWRKVKRAVITHAHSDHARWGMEKYLAHPISIPVMRARLGQDIAVEGLDYNKTINLNGVKLSFHPAGHIPGSAQVRVEYQGEVWVASGDYKLEDDGISTPFESVKCHTFISECTFGLPVFRWETQAEIMAKINAWWAANAAEGKASVIGCYALGKAQRILCGVDSSIGPIYVHGATDNMNQTLIEAGLSLPETRKPSDIQRKGDYAGALVLCPPSALGSAWMKKFEPCVTANASGWMTMRGTRRRGATDTGFILSDHADWPGLATAIAESGAEKVIMTHGYTSVYAQWLRDEQGIDALEAQTEYTADGRDTEEEPAAPAL